MMNTPMTRERQLNIRLSEDEEERLERLAKQHGLSAAALFRKMLRSEEARSEDTLSKVDRVVLIKLLELQQAVKPKEAKHLETTIQILRNGYEIFYSEVLGDAYEPVSADKCRFVLDVLDMYRAIEHYKKKHPKDRETAKHAYATFRGFDGNNETDLMAFARFMIEEQEKWEEQLPYKAETDSWNSHFPVASTYADMVRRWKPLSSKFALTAEQVRMIIGAN